MIDNLQKLRFLGTLTRAEVCCKECGTKYGKYSVGCSSTWYGDCDVCGEHKPVTEVRDYGYLTKGIAELKASMDEDEDEPALYEQGEITLKLTEDEVSALSQIFEDHIDAYPGAEYESVAEKISQLYEDHCVKYSLSPALLAYHAKYGSFGTGEDSERWEIFRDAYNLGVAGGSNE